MCIAAHPRLSCVSLAVIVLALIAGFITNPLMKSDEVSGPQELEPGRAESGPVQMHSPTTIDERSAVSHRPLLGRSNSIRAEPSRAEQHFENLPHSNIAEAQYPSIIGKMRGLPLDASRAYFEHLVTTEPIDPKWAPTREASLLNIIQNTNLFGAAAVDRVICRKTICKISVTNAYDHYTQTDLLRLPRLNGNISEVHLEVDPSAPGFRAVIYLLRPAR